MATHTGMSRIGIAASIAFLAAAVPEVASASGPVHQQAELTGSDSAAGDRFGVVSALSGSLLAVGAPDRSNGGEVYIFTLSSGVWTQTAELTGSDTVSGDLFGQALSLSVTSSGTMLVVGAEGRGGGSDGAIYVFTESGGNWTQTQEIAEASTSTYGQFGWDVAASSTTIVASAIATDGAVLTFTKNMSGVWTRRATLTATDEAAGDAFGYHVALAGSTILATSPYHNSGTGALYVFPKTSGHWTQSQELTGSDAVANDNFGIGEVTVSGTRALVGSPLHASGAGSAYVFINTSGTWAQTAELTASDATAGDHFGLGAAMTGTHVVVGADRHLSVAGNAYYFADVSGVWTQKQEFTGSDTVAGDAFGRDVAVAGTTAEVGAPNRSNGGAAYIFSI